MNERKIKLFISQPMRDKTNQEIAQERMRAAKDVEGRTGGKVEVLDTFFQDFKGNPLQLLAKAIGKLAEADVAYFAHGWQDARGCRIEHMCAEEYNISIIEADEDESCWISVEDRMPTEDGWYNVCIGDSTDTVHYDKIHGFGYWDGVDNIPVNGVTRWSKVTGLSF